MSSNQTRRNSGKGGNSRGKQSNQQIRKDSDEHDDMKQHQRSGGSSSSK